MIRSAFRRNTNHHGTRPLLVASLLIALALAIGHFAVLLPKEVSAELGQPANCHGDEIISFAPAEPTAGDILLIAATSAQEHPGVWLAGPGRPEAFRTYQGKLGHVWNFLIPTTSPGVYRFQFYVDSTLLCAEATITVLPSVSSSPLITAVPESIPQQTRVPAAVRDDSDNGDNRDNGSDGDNDNDADDDGDNDNTDNEATLRAPDIQSLSSDSLCPGSTLRIEGRGFGDQRSTFGGSIVIGNVQVRDYLSWTDRKIAVLVPTSAVPGEDRQVFVITDGGFDESEVEIAESGCSEEPKSEAAPRIGSVSPAQVCAQAVLTIRGSGFGAQRSTVGGSIVIGNAQVRDYLSWTDREIVVLVPSSAVPGDDRQLFVVTDGGFDESELEVADSGCSEEPAAQRAPRIRSVDPPQVCAQSVLVIRGVGFGESRSALQGKVVVGGAEVRDYLSWRNNQLTVLVPAGANVGTQQRLYVLTSAGFHDVQIQIDSPPC